MHFNLKFRTAASFALIAGTLFTACRQEKSALNADDNGGYASDASRIEWINNDIISIADAAGFYYNGTYLRTTGTTAIGCATVATDTISNPRTLIIRYGNNNCTALDGRNRRGTIIVSYAGRYKDSAKLRTITFDNYYINDHQVLGSIKMVRVDTTVAGDWYYKVQVDDSLDMNPDPIASDFITWKGNLVRKWVTGFTTGDRSDDVFSVSGIATLTRQNRHVYSFGISTPLQFALNCDYAQSGVINVGGYEGARVLTYGQGGCDANAQVAIGPTTYQVLLSK